MYVRNSGNLWSNPVGTSGGVTLSNNADGSVAASGTATGLAMFAKDADGMEPGTTYTVSIDREIAAVYGADEGACFYISLFESEVNYSDMTFGCNGVTKTTFTTSEKFTHCVCAAIVRDGTEVSGDFKIMLNEGSEAMPWVPPGTVVTPDVPVGDGFRAGSHHLADFGQCIASRSTGAPDKKTSTVTVPHMSGFWDFSKVYGELAYESREVSYTIELIGEDRADLQDQKSALMAWLLEVHDEPIYDDDIPGWHFVGSCSECEWDEGEEGESGTLTATFLCQPFLYRDDETTLEMQVGDGQTVSNAGMAAEVTAVASEGTATITLGGIKQSVSTTPQRLVARLMPGDNAVSVSGAAVTLRWNETRI